MLHSVHLSVHLSVYAIHKVAFTFVIPAAALPTIGQYQIKLYCLLTVAHGCEQLARGCYSTAWWPGLKLTTTESPV